jgi:DNA adenine methylase
MRYLGGKSRLAKKIAQAIMSDTDIRENYLEPFVGGGSVLSEMTPYFKNVWASDLDPDIILLWKELQNGWTPPSNLSEEEYELLKHSEPSALRSFAKYGCSFGGKPWGGYARGNGQNYADESKRNLLRQLPAIKPVQFEECDFVSWTDLENTVIYCDPPYINTTSYQSLAYVDPKGYKMFFDHARFWNVMDKWSKVTQVYVSEKCAPAGWESVWQIERSARVSGGNGAMVEHLFTKSI